MRIAIVGFSGFVGLYIHSHVLEYYPNAVINLYNSKNIEDIRGEDFDLLYNAGVSAVKWKANKNPKEDLKAIESLLDCLSNVKCKRVVHVSTIDVENKSSGKYGKHRLSLEDMMQAMFSNCLVVRLSGLFGFGMKKNVIYDSLTNKDVTLMPGAFQWYPMDHFSSDLKKNEKTTGIIRLYGLPLDNAILAEILDVPLDKDKTRVTYNVPGDKETTYELSLVRFVNKWKKWVPRIGISSISGHSLQTFGVESVPLDRNKTAKSVQSLFWPSKDNLFDKVDDFIETTLEVISNHGKSRAFTVGSPKNRTVGHRDRAECIRVYRNYLRAVLPWGPVFTENNSTHYGCDFMRTPEEVVAVISQVPGAKMTFDVGNVLLEGLSPYDELRKYSEYVGHVHFSSASMKRLDYCPNYLMSIIPDDCRVTYEAIRVSMQDVRLSLLSIMCEPTQNIIGAGWYGCHASKLCIERDIPFVLFETSEIFSGASSYNQNRLHLGYHYPRCKKTRQLCISGFEKFMEEYGFLTSPVDNNLYKIDDKDSVLDRGTYETIIDNDIPNRHVKVSVGYHVDERRIDSTKAKEYFMNLLGKHTVYERAVIEGAHSMNIDCTNGPYEGTKIAYTLSVLGYSNRTVTIMDGPFYSIYPYNDTLHTLTHVTLGVTDHQTIPLYKIIEMDDLSDEVKTQVDTMVASTSECRFRPISVYLSRKYKIDRGCDDRSTYVYRNMNGTTYRGGKISGIFDIQINV